VASERMVGAALGKEGFELLPDGLDEVRFECGNGACSLRSGSVENSPNDGASVCPLYTTTHSLLTEALNHWSLPWFSMKCARVMHLEHMSHLAEASFLHYILDFIRFCAKRHPP
jgi:hypothetical protein